MVSDSFWIKERRPAMTIQIEKDYFENNINAEGYILNEQEGVYTTTITDNNLNFEFSADTDGNWCMNINTCVFSEIILKF